MKTLFFSFQKIPKCAKIVALSISNRFNLKNSPQAIEMFVIVRKSTSSIGTTHRLEQHFGITKWFGFKKPHIQFDAVFHALFEYRL